VKIVVTGLLDYAWVMKWILSLFLIFFCASLMAAESAGYKIVHPDGTVEFTDDATRGGEEIKLKGVQTVRSLKEKGAVVGPLDSKPSSNQGSESSGYVSLNIVSPQNEQTLWFDSNGVTVSVATVPGLGPEDSVVVSLDGVTRAKEKRSSLNIGLVDRGSHTLSASIVDADGNILISSSPVTFFLRQHTKK
jgi:hypothetical protein